MARASYASRKIKSFPKRCSARADEAEYDVDGVQARPGPPRRVGVELEQRGGHGGADDAGREPVRAAAELLGRRLRDELGDGAQLAPLERPQLGIAGDRRLAQAREVDLVVRDLTHQDARGVG